MILVLTFLNAPSDEGVGGEITEILLLLSLYAFIGHFCIKYAVFLYYALYVTVDIFTYIAKIQGDLQISVTQLAQSHSFQIRGAFFIV